LAAEERWVGVDVVSRTHQGKVAIDLFQTPQAKTSKPKIFHVPKDGFHMGIEAGASAQLCSQFGAWEQGGSRPFSQASGARHLHGRRDHSGRRRAAWFPDDGRRSQSRRLVCDEERACLQRSRASQSAFRGYRGQGQAPRSAFLHHDLSAGPHGPLRGPGAPVARPPAPIAPPQRFYFRVCIWTSAVRIE